jgi:hypothetical protein
MRELKLNGVKISESEYDAVFNANDNNKALRDLMLSKGIDGVIYKNEAEGKGDSYIALQQSQIRRVGATFESSLNSEEKKSSSFDEWISNSKIKDINNNAIVVYHGTNQAFNEFDMDKSRDGGHWFVADKSHAEHFGKVDAYYLAINNPMIISQDDLELEWDKEHPEGYPDDRDLLPRDFVADFVEKAKELGHDGLVIKGMADLNTAQDMYLAFSPGQIKRVESAHLNERDVDTNEGSAISESSTTLTESALMIEIGRCFPRLVPAAEEILRRGKEGLHGGAIIINTDDQSEIVAFMEKEFDFDKKACFNVFEGRDSIQGFYESSSGMTFIIGKNMSPEQAVPVLFHELAHSLQNNNIDTHAMSLLENRQNESGSTREFLDRVAERMLEANEASNPKEVLAYIVEQAIVESLIDSSKSNDCEFSNFQK